ncbi:MAG: AMP-binding protein, partial [Acidimicrobiales bacterium]
MAGLTDLLAARAGAEPDRPAFVVDGADSLSFRSWERRSNAVARGLLDRGIGAGDRVVLWFDSRRWTEYAVASAAVLKVGAVAVPVGAHRQGLDLVGVLSHCGAAAIVVAADSIVPAAVGVPDPRSGGRSGLSAASVADLAEGQPETPPPSPVPPEAIEIVYPSGHLRPPRPTVHAEAEILGRLAATVRSGETMLHAFAIGSDAARLALWAPLAPRSEGRSGPLAPRSEGRSGPGSATVV